MNIFVKAFLVITLLLNLYLLFTNGIAFIVLLFGILPIIIAIVFADAIIKKFQFTGLKRLLVKLFIMSFPLVLTATITLNLVIIAFQFSPISDELLKPLFFLIVTTGSFILSNTYFKKIDNFNETAWNRPGTLSKLVAGFAVSLILMYIFILIGNNRVENFLDTMANSMELEVVRSVDDDKNASLIINSDMADTISAMEGESVKLFGKLNNKKDSFTDDELSSFIENNSSTLKKLKNISSMSAYFPVPKNIKAMSGQEVAAILLPATRNYRTAHTALLLETLYMAKKGDARGAVDSISAARALVRQLADGSTMNLVAPLVAINMSNADFDLVQYLLKSGTMPPVLLKGLDNGHINSIYRSFRRSMEFENFAYLKMVQFDSIDTCVKALTYSTPTNFDAPICYILITSKALMNFGDLEGYFFNQLAMFDKVAGPKGEKAQTGYGTYLDYIKGYKEYSKKSTNYINNSKSLYFVVFSSTDLSSYYFRKQVAFAKIELIRMADSVFNYKEKYGKYPESIEELKKASENKFADPFGNEDLRMKKEKDKLLLYSVGVDSKDNGGFMEDTGYRYSLDSVENSKGDIVLEIKIS